MARNTGTGSRKGSVSGRTQTKTPGGNWTKRDAASGRFMDQKTSSPKPFKGVAKEPDGRRTNG